MIKSHGTAETIDMTRGVYRRVYSCWLHGRRINAVSDSAEILFARLILVADDFGNLLADPKAIRSACFPRKESWTVRRIEKALAELLASGGSGKPSLVTKYGTTDDGYIHITDWDEMQPAGKNGRRIQRHPLYHKPEAIGDPGYSKAIQGDPGESSASDTDAESESNSESDSDADADEGFGVVERMKPGESVQDQPDEPAMRVWAGRSLRSDERRKLVEVTVSVMGQPPAVIHGKPMPRIDLWRLCLAKATEAASFNTMGSALGYIASMAERCVDQECLPGEWPTKANGHAPPSSKSVVEAALATVRRPKP